MLSSTLDGSVEGDGGAVLLDQVSNVYNQYLVLPPGAADALALVVAHFHCYKAFEHTPRLSFQAMEKGCGKTTALKVTACLSPNALLADNMSAAVMFRLTHSGRATLLLDEVDAWLLGNEELRGILNSGHSSSAQLFRCENPRGTVRGYKLFSPVALAGIGSIPETLQDRSVVIRLTRAKPGEIRVRFDSRRTAAEEYLRDRLSQWTFDHFSDFESCDPLLPPGARNRLGDNWRPLFAIAEVAGRDWPARALRSFNLLNQNALKEDQSIRVQLLFDVRNVFQTLNASRLSSAELAVALARLEGRPWAEYQGRRAISTHQIAHLLRGFDVYPKTIRFGDGTAKGYSLDGFQDVFERFLPRP